MASTRFTADDRIHPTYCHGCRTMIPRLMSDSNGHLCTDCFNSSQVALKQKATNHQERVQVKRQAVRQYTAGLGECPSCSSTNLVKIPGVPVKTPRAFLIRVGVFLLVGGALVSTLAPVTYSLDGLGLILTGILLGASGFCFPKPTIHGEALSCNYCGNVWKLKPPDAPTQ